MLAAHRPVAEFRMSYLKATLALSAVGLVGLFLLFSAAWLPGLIILGVCGWGAWAVSSLPEDVVSITAEGFLDRRISPDVIPWGAVRAVSVWRRWPFKAMVLKVDSDILKTLRRPAFGAMMGALYGAFGAEGLFVNHASLQTDFDTLYGTAKSYWRASGIQ